MRSRTFGSASERVMSTPHHAAERAAHDRATDRAAGLAQHLFAKVRSDLAGDAIDDRARHLAGDRLTGGEPLTAPVGAEHAAEEAADAAEDAAAGRGFGLAAGARGADRRRAVVRPRL